MANCFISLSKFGTIVAVDTGIQKLLGYEPEELITRPFEDILASPYKELVDIYIYNSAKRFQGGSLTLQPRVLEAQHKDGRILPVQLSVSILGESYDKGNPQIICFVEESKDKSVIITTDQNGVIVSCNNNVEFLFGFKPTEISSKKLNVLLPLETDFLRASVGAGQPSFDYLVRNTVAQHKTGNRFPVCYHVKPFKVGEFVLYHNQVFKMDNSVEALLTIDDREMITSCCQHFMFALFGFRASELIGRPLGVFLPKLTRCVPDTLNSDHMQPQQKKKQKRSSNATYPAMELLVQQWCCKSEEQSEEQVVPQLVEALHKDGSVVSAHLEVFPWKHDDKQKFALRLSRIGDDFNSRKQSDTSTLNSTASSIVGSVTAAPGLMPHLALPTNIQKIMKKIGEYVPGEVIGKGSFGKVKKAIHFRTREKVAIKILSKTSMSDVEVERAKREVQILQQMRHPNIVQLIQTIDTPKQYCMVMEYVDGCDLMAYILQKGGLPEHECQKLFVQLVSALNYCHERDIIHRDIKHTNILVDKSGDIKLIDFGLSNYFGQDGQLLSTFCGTPAFAAPEMILGKKYQGPEVDIWSLGVVLYSMLAAKFPFNNVAELLQGSFQDPPNVSPTCRDLLRRMLVVSPENRTKLSQIFTHPWCTSQWAHGDEAGSWFTN